MAHKWGGQTPNGEFNPSDIVDVFGDGVYIIMQGEFNKLPALRDAAPRAFIMGRFYLPNWYTTNAVMWANQIGRILMQVNASDDKHRRNMDMLDAYTWANEENLAAESGGVIGSTPSAMIKPGHYDIITAWNMRFLDAVEAIPEIKNYPRVFPAYAMGNSDDQDDGGGVGLVISKPVIYRCQYGAIHPYWNADKPIDDQWYGLGRIHKQLPFFRGLPVIVTETGNFAVTRPDAWQQYTDAGYYMQGIPEIWPGFCFFIFADPTNSHRANDMSRNPAIYDAIKRAVKIDRPVEWRAVEPVAPPVVPDQPPDTPEPLPIPPEANLPLFDAARGLRIAYQVWQWSGVATVATYAHLKRDMDQIGAVILSDKYSDSNVLQGRFDDDPLAVTSIQVMKDRKKWCEDNGFIYIPWDVPRAIPVAGNPFEGARQEARFHADVCNQVGLEYRVSDLEFYPSFFGWSLDQPNNPAVSFFRDDDERNDGAEVYYETFAANSNTKTILQPDPRQWDTIQFNRLKKYLYAVVWQSYAYWFRLGGDIRPHSEIVTDSINKAKALELPAFGLSLYSDKGTVGNTPANLARELCQQATDSKASLLFVYKAPVSSTLQPVLKQFATPLGGIVMDEEIQDVRNGAWAGASQAEELANKFDILAARARGFGYGWMANGFDGTALSLRGLSLAAKASLKAPKE